MNKGVSKKIIVGIVIAIFISPFLIFNGYNYYILNSMKEEVALMGITAPLAYSKCHLSDGFESGNFCIFDFQTEDWQSMMDSILDLGYSHYNNETALKYIPNNNNENWSLDFIKLGTKRFKITVYNPRTGITRMEIH